MRALCGGELGAKRPWLVCDSIALPCSLTELTSPTLSPVKSVCKFFSFLSSASSSSSRRSASSLRSYSPSVSDSDDSGEAGRNAVGSRRWPPRSVRTEEEAGRLVREGELLVSEFRRARTPSGAVSRTDVDSLERLSLRPAPGNRRGKLGRFAVSSRGASAFCVPSCAGFGLKEPLMT